MCAILVDIGSRPLEVGTISTRLEAKLLVDDVVTFRHRGKAASLGNIGFLVHRGHERDELRAFRPVPGNGNLDLVDGALARREREVDLDVLELARIAVLGVEVGFQQGVLPDLQPRHAALDTTGRRGGDGLAVLVDGRLVQAELQRATLDEAVAVVPDRDVERERAACRNEGNRRVAVHHRGADHVRDGGVPHVCLVMQVDGVAFAVGVRLHLLHAQHLERRQPVTRRDDHHVGHVMVDLGHHEGIREVLLVDACAHQLVEMGVALVERLVVPAVVVDAAVVALASLGPEDEGAAAVDAKGVDVEVLRPDLREMQDGRAGRGIGRIVELLFPPGLLERPPAAVPVVGILPLPALVELLEVVLGREGREEAVLLRPRHQPHARLEHRRHLDALEHGELLVELHHKEVGLLR